MNDDELRGLVPIVIGVLERRGADFSTAEDAVQEALIEAFRTWSEDDPRDLKGWLISTRQIAEAYLVPEATMAQCISRAKRTLAGRRLNRPGHVSAVLSVLYLVFNKGYSGDVDLAAEAIRLTRVLAESIDHAEVSGLLALMLIHHTETSSPRVSASCRQRSPATSSANSRPRRRSRHCMPMPDGSRRPTGHRSWSGTTNS